MDSVCFSCRQDPLPSAVAVLVADPLHLVKASDGIADVCRIRDWFFAGLREGKLLVGQATLFRCSHASRAPWNVFSVSSLALDLTGLLNVLSCRFLLLVGRHIKSYR